VRLAGAHGSLPNWGLVRVELPLLWFERLGDAAGLEHVNRLSLALCEYRCRERSYGRQAVSLHPIVRAEQLLGALFGHGTQLASRFYRVAGF
jgi:hypothetical protein